MHSHVKTMLTLLGVVLLAACNDSTATVNGDASGTYNLTAINNSSLPFTLRTTTTDTLVLKSGSITLNADRTFTETLSADETTGGVTTNQTNVCPGTYVQSGNNFTFTEATSTNQSCGGAYTARWDGSGVVSLFFTGFQLDYSKIPVAL